ncbi:ricin-type beta-trefoil lectin domain protein [Streptomyces sp. NEAU-H22]|uniref:ricin-type beta-trefoil lectin domain protein n=1 Tax=unclassified Streptomyces TaxID=2593676 RepID=UPI00225B88A2|nr:MULTISPECIES: ricin-type beta-trefoil lectin domain protein [unclassified Streptomyces]MCX3289998.1 ricin-type beta-trefoil lectin domain protein [Streptomyces sp. NEAU-H22]WMD05978.1 ricin-type beta-trefoil lectin domain protein [Streptomyces sp. FXY-T5]
MKDAGPSNSPASARRFGATDEQLSAELRKWTGATPALHPVGELLDRHWEAAFAYARLCTDGPRSAGMLTTAAFTRLFGETLRQNGPSAAWRPHLLLTVRRIAAEWAGDHRLDSLHPQLLTGTGDGDRPASRLLPSQHRRLLSGAFQRLPQSARCLLWHVEVEAEPLISPAGLLGLDEEGARVELGRARDRLREECLQLHRELAPDEECRRYLRLLDVTYRRGGLDIDPDLRAHIEGCGHCSAAADQLDQFNHDLGVALSEAVLGWGGRDYAQSRAHAVGERAGGRDAAERERPGSAAGAATAVMPAGAARDLFPDPVALAREVFPDPVDLAYEIIPDPVRAPRESFPGPAREGRREPFPDQAGGAGGVFPDRVGGAREAFPDRVGGAGGVFPDPVRGARDAFPGPAGEGREVFPDPVALAGAVGESFTDPGGPAATPPPPRIPPGVDPAAGAAQAAARADRAVTSPPAPPARRPEGPRTAARRTAHKAARRAARRRNLTAGILTVSGLVVLPLVLWSTGNSGDGAPAGSDRPTGEVPDSDAGEASGDSSWAGAGEAEKGALRGRLHNVSSGLCVGIDGKKAVAGGEAELAPCSAEAAQQWTYETDGRLRNGAAPDLCLDSRLGYSVRLAPCTGASRPDPKNIRYDFTLQGALVPRSDQDLALTPAATDGSGALVLKARVDDEVQRWVIDTSKADLQMEAVTWNAAVPAQRSTPAPTPTPSRTPKPTPTPSVASPAPRPTPSGPAATDSPCDRYGYYCDSDGRYGNPGHGYPGYGYGGYGYGYGGGRR